MRRENNLFLKNNTLSLMSDCIYFCWQNKEIEDEEYNLLTKCLIHIDKKIRDDM